VQHAAVELFALLVERGKRVAMDRDEELARDKQVHLAQRLGILVTMAPSAIKHQEHVVAEVIQLGALAEMLGVFQRQRVKAEELLQLREVVVAWRREIQPEKVVTLEVIADPSFVDARAAGHYEREVVARARHRYRLGLAYGHARLLGRC
jgi:hypothetical protein